MGQAIGRILTCFASPPGRGEPVDIPHRPWVEKRGPPPGRRVLPVLPAPRSSASGLSRPGFQTILSIHGLLRVASLSLAHPTPSECLPPAGLIPAKKGRSALSVNRAPL